MGKIKILVLAEFMPKEEFLTNPEYMELIKSFGEDADFDFADDTNPKRCSDLSEYVLKMEQEGPEWTVPDAEVLEKIKDADVLLVGMSGVPAKMIDAGKKLKFIGAMRSGFENINVQHAEKKGIVVRNCPGRLAEPVADMTLAMIISETRGIIRGNLTTNHGEWNKMDIFEDVTNRPMCLLKTGVIGLGLIGQSLAKRLIACGSNVMAYDPYANVELFSELGVKNVDMDHLIKNSDIVVMMARLTDETRGMFGAKQFAMMKPTAIFVNTARAGLVDEDALVDALQSGKIRGAALDVYSQEPLPKDHPLLQMNNVTLMPHRAGVTSGIGPNSMRLMLETVRKYLDRQRI